jgi:hypothetical protein
MLVLTSSPSGADEANPSHVRTIPFPPETYVAKVTWPLPPKVERQADRFIVELPAIEGVGPVTCVVTASEDLRVRSALVLARQRTELPDLSHATVADLSVAPHLPLLFMTVRRSGGNPVHLATFRDPRTSFACLQDTGDTSALNRVVTDMAMSIRPSRESRAKTLVRFCRLSLKDGSVGFERWQVEERGNARSSVVNSSLVFRHGDGVDYMEVDAIETGEPNGTIGRATLTRALDGTPEVQSTIRHRRGPSYEYELVTKRGPTSGEFRTKVSAGLPSVIAIRERVKRELVAGRGESFSIEIWDPFSPQREATETTYSLESRVPTTIKLIQGPRQWLQLVDDNGFVKHAELRLLGNDLLVSDCETQRDTR